MTKVSEPRPRGLRASFDAEQHSPAPGPSATRRPVGASTYEASGPGESSPTTPLAEVRAKISTAVRREQHLNRQHEPIEEGVQRPSVDEAVGAELGKFDALYAATRQQLSAMGLDPDAPSAVSSAFRAYQLPALLDGAGVSQLEGDPSGRNANCAYASALSALRLLKVTPPSPSDEVLELGGSEEYSQVMALRQLSGGGLKDTVLSEVFSGGDSPRGVVVGLEAAGANADVLENTWGDDKDAAVQRLAEGFLTATEPTAFIVAGSPPEGWPNDSEYRGGHFVTVAGFDPLADRFTVLDPLKREPLSVDRDQLAAYLADDEEPNRTVYQELVRVTP